MSLNTPLEGLLRPPVEWYSSAMCMVEVMLLYIHAALFVLPISLTDIIGCCILLAGFYRFHQGLRIWRYQRNLKSMPSYTMSSAELPVSTQQLFLGKGFLWTPVHTQRLRDLDLDYNLPYRYPSKLYQ